MKKKVLIWVLAAVLVLSMAGCAAGAVSSNDKYVGMEPTAAAEAAAAETKDTTSISDLIRVPFGYLLDWLYTFTNSYGLALILFSLIVKLVLLPMSVKSKKSMLKMSRLSPQVKALEAKYGDDKQKYQLAVQQMYKEEGVSMGGGCLWSFIPLLILLPLYNVIREPITYMMHNSRSISEAIVAFLQASGENLGKNAYYAQLAAAGHIGDYADKLREVLQSIMGSDVKINLQAMNFQFLGIDLAAIPTFRFWDCEGWSEIGLFLIPVVSAGLQAVSMWISQKMNNQGATNADGEQDVMGFFAEGDPFRRYKAAVTRAGITAAQAGTATAQQAGTTAAGFPERELAVPEAGWQQTLLFSARRGEAITGFIHPRQAIVQLRPAM